MRFAFYRGVGFRLAVWLTSIIVLLVTLHMILVQSESRLSRSREEDGRWLAQVVRAILSQRTSDGHRKNLTSHLRAVQSQPDVISIQIFAPGGHLFASGDVDTSAGDRFNAQFRRGAPCGSCHTPAGGPARSMRAVTRIPGRGDALALTIPLVSGPECSPCHTASLAPIGHLHLGLSLERQEEARTRARRRLIAYGTVILLVALTGIALTVHRVVGRPLRRAVATMEKVRAGDLKVRLPVDRDDEIGYLSAAFNAMAERIERVEEELRLVISKQTEEIRRGQEKIIHQEKMAAVGLLAAGVAHEIGNPLTAISSIVQLLHHRSEDEGLKKQTAMILSQIDRISRIVRELSDFSRPPSLEKGWTDLNEIVRAALQLARYDRRSRGLEVRVDLTPGLPHLYVVADQIFQVFFNLVLNAIDAMPAGGTLEVRTHARPGEIVVEVRDSGTGIPPENLTRIFEPFFTTKKPGKGTGLGLSVLYGIVRALGGRIEVESRSGQGSLFRVVLPDTLAGPGGPEPQSKEG